MNFLDIFSYAFMIRSLEAGVVVAVIAPLIGIFLVLRRYSLIADTLAHVSLAGIALGALLGVNPILTAVGVTAVSSLGMEQLRLSKRVYGESALALFLSGSLAFAVVLIGFARGISANLSNYLFGSIVTVTNEDVILIGALAAIIITVLALYYKELVYISFDEEAARVGGIPTRAMNTVFLLLAALTVALAIPIVGVLLISALITIPVVTALLVRKSFLQTLIYAEAISVGSVVSGIITSFYMGTAAGGTIVLIMLAVFCLVFFTRRA